MAQQACGISEWMDQRRLCFSAASGFWLAGEHGKATAWLVLGDTEMTAIMW